MTENLRQLVEAAAASGPASMRSAARLMSLVADAPSRLPEIYRAAAEVDRIEAGRLTLPRFLLGVTGAPGSGKSTLTDTLVRAYRQRHPDRRIGVVAVDPSSPFTGGAVLGDRVRMMRHATDPMVFVRSLASRGHLGGLALGAKGVIRVMGLMGCDVVFIETVGVGQSEVEVAAVADLVMIVLAPGQGDSIQLLKAGLMEIGDLFVVNKADRPEAARLRGELLSMLRVARDQGDGHHAHRATAGGDRSEGEPIATGRAWPAAGEPLTFLVSAEQGQGVEKLVESLEEQAERHGEEWRRHRLLAIDSDVREAVLEEATARIRDALRASDPAGNPVEAILSGRLSVEDAAREALERAAARARVD